MKLLRTIGLPGVLASVIGAILPGLGQTELKGQGFDDVAIVVGENFAWTIEAPEKWDLEPAGARAAGLGAAFIPEGTTWGTAETILYGISIPKSSTAGSIEEIMRQDSIRTEGRQPGTLVEEADPIGTIQGIDARVRHYYAADSSTIEAVAYLDGPTAVAVVVLNSRSIDAFRESLPSFTRLVDSYEWITSDPEEIARMRGK